MKLAGDDVIMFEGGDERLAMIRDRCRELWCGLYPIAIGEIGIAGHKISAGSLCLVLFQPNCGTLTSEGKRPTSPSTTPRPFAPGLSLLASNNTCSPTHMVSVGLPARTRSAIGPAKPARFKAGHGRAEGADARENHALRRLNLRRFACAPGAGIELLESGLDRSEIGRPRRQD